MKTSKHLVVGTMLAAVLALAGCSSTPTKVDTGPIKVATFNFVRKPSVATPNFADSSAPIHALIQQAIADHLAAKGVSRVEVGGDVTVAYLVVVGNNASTMAVNDYFGYGRDFSQLQDKAHQAYTENKNPNYFEAGTLLIDIIDTRTHELLKRSHVTRPILREATLEVRQARIQEAVDAALKDLRIAH